MGKGGIRPCLAWRIIAPDGQVYLRETRAQARMILGRLREVDAMRRKAFIEANLRTAELRKQGIFEVDEMTDEEAMADD